MWIQPIVFVPKLLELGTIGELTMHYFNYEIKQIVEPNFNHYYQKIII